MPFVEYFEQIQRLVVEVQAWVSSLVTLEQSVETLEAGAELE